jgi:hypothetical protein
MFFKKKDTSSEKKENVAEKGIKTMDTVVT